MTSPLAVRPTIPLQQGIVYGPVSSRRLGRSLGLNILPGEIKVCSMDCRYCQYSWTGMPSFDPGPFEAFLPSREEVRSALESSLMSLAERGAPPDVITFSGNGEATLHPEFPAIVRDALALRDAHAPGCLTAILSNSTTACRAPVREALLFLDEPILKLDAGREETFRALNRGANGVRWADVLKGLRALGGKIILQALFVRGRVDNSTDDEVAAWAEEVRRIGPRSVQLYSLDRGPADPALGPVPKRRLLEIASILASVAKVEARVFA